VVEEHAETVNADLETLTAIIEKLKAWSDSLSPSEQVMLGLLLKRLGEDGLIAGAADARGDEPPVP
jgi:hypothetical protein